ncbi:hypothetical protein HV461_11885 [Bacillus sporothermodurans]|nr:hypothetical protein [Heyndrickxia sporothermodurans]MBL5811340.1 hypothetical protein [Heyndrickxia sporothermodurans]
MVENIVTRIMMMTFLFTQLYGLNQLALHEVPESQGYGKIASASFA